MRPENPNLFKRSPAQDPTSSAVAEEVGVRTLMVGFSHHSAPLAILERLAVRGSAVECLTAAALELGCLEAVVLSTCCRTEVYAVVADGDDGSVSSGLRAALASRAG